jgi:hypothetical protein
VSRYVVVIERWDRGYKRVRAAGTVDAGADEAPGHRLPPGDERTLAT